MLVTAGAPGCYGGRLPRRRGLHRTEPLAPDDARAGAEHQYRRRLAARERWAAQAERDRVARELHDSVKQQLFTIRTHLATAQTLTRKNNPEAERYLQSAAAITQHAQSELGAIIQVLHHAAGGSAALSERWRELLSQWSAQTGIAAELHTEAAPRLPVAAEHALTRVLQEALVNIYKHSGACRVLVRLGVVAGQLYLEVTDDGHGLDPATMPVGRGLTSMHERVETLGGRLTIERGEAGVSVRAEIAVG